MADPYADLANASKEMQERVAAATAEALKAEARTRVARQAFFGFMSYVSVIARASGATS